MPTDFRGLPGIYSGTKIVPRNIFTNRQSSANVFVPSLAVIDGTYSRDASAQADHLRAGNMMGIITSGGKYRPSIIGVTQANYTSGGTSLTVLAGVATEIARLIALAGTSISLKAVGPPTAAGTNAVTSVTCSAASGTTLTVSSLGVDKVSGTAICPADGSQIPVTVLADDDGVVMTDINGAALDQPMGRYLIRADLIAKMVCYLTDLDASAETYFKQQLNGGGTASTGNFTFDDAR